MTLSRISRGRRHSRLAFTLIELLTVITIILILVGLVIGAAGYANTKAARSRAEGEMRALGTVLENYKSDNGAYPRSTETDKLDARTQADPSSYKNASKDLYALLSGQVDDKGLPLGYAYPRPVTNPANPNRNYWGELKPNILGGVTNGTGTVTAINDPYGYSYGYSTAYQADLEAKQAKTPPDTTPPTKGYNPTFDLWSVANKASTNTTAATLDTTVRPAWIVNW